MSHKITYKIQILITKIKDMLYKIFLSVITCNTATISFCLRFQSHIKYVLIKFNKKICKKVITKKKKF